MSHIEWILMVLIILIVVFIILKKRRVYIPLISAFVLLIVFTIALTFMNQTYPQGEIYIDNYTKDVELVLIKNELQYTNNDDLELKNEPTNLFPIYLKSLDEYYLVVYSKDINKTLLNGLYIQYDYEFYSEDVDRLYLISKSTGKFLVPRVYDLIGSTINLDETLSYGDTIMIPVYKPYTQDINYYYSIRIYEGSIQSFVTSDIVALTLDRNIIKFDFIEDMLVVLYDDDTISFSSTKLQSVSETEGSHSISYSGKYYRILDDQIYAKQGYFKFHNDLLYIVGNDMGIYKFQYETLIFVKTLDALDNFSTEVDNL